MSAQPTSPAVTLKQEKGQPPPKEHNPWPHVVDTRVRLFKKDKDILENQVFKMSREKDNPSVLKIDQWPGGIVNHGNVYADFKEMYREKEYEQDVMDGKVLAIYRLGGTGVKINQGSSLDDFPNFHQLDRFDPQLFYKTNKLGIPVPFEAPTDEEGNVYLSTETPGEMIGPLLQSQPGTYYYDGAQSFDRVLGPDDPDQAILMLTRGEKPEVVQRDELIKESLRVNACSIL